MNLLRSSGVYSTSQTLTCILQQSKTQSFFKWTLGYHIFKTTVLEKMPVIVEREEGTEFDPSAMVGQLTIDSLQITW